MLVHLLVQTSFGGSDPSTAVGLPEGLVAGSAGAALSEARRVLRFSEDVFADL